MKEESNPSSQSTDKHRFPLKRYFNPFLMLHFAGLSVLAAAFITIACLDWDFTFLRVPSIWFTFFLFWFLAIFMFLIACAELFRLMEKLYKCEPFFDSGAKIIKVGRILNDNRRWVRCIGFIVSCPMGVNNFCEVVMRQSGGLSGGLRE